MAPPFSSGKAGSAAPLFLFLSASPASPEPGTARWTWPSFRCRLCRVTMHQTIRPKASRIQTCLPPAPGPPSPAVQDRYSACDNFFSAGL